MIYVQAMIHLRRRYSSRSSEEWSKVNWSGLSTDGIVSASAFSLNEEMLQSNRIESDVVCASPPVLPQHLVISEVTHHCVLQDNHYVFYVYACVMMRSVTFGHREALMQFIASSCSRHGRVLATVCKAAYVSKVYKVAKGLLCHIRP